MADDPDLPDPADETEAVDDADSPLALGEPGDDDFIDVDDETDEDSDEDDEPLDDIDPGDEPQPDVQQSDHAAEEGDLEDTEGKTEEGTD